MRTTTKRTATIAASAAVCLAVAGAVAPGAVAAEKVDGDVAISNTETVSVLMGANGKIDKQRVYDQLVLSGKGKVDVSNPVSTKGLRNLDGFGGWTVRDGAQRINTDVDGEQKYRSVSDFTGDLPISIDVKYTLDGKRVEPGDVVGKSGELEVRYTVTNVTGKQQDVTYTDGKGEEQTKSESVVIPLVGSMTTVLPSTFTDVRTEGANAAGDGRGGTQLSFTMTLFPPIGSDRATFGYTAKIKDGVVPKAALSLLPVNPLENTSFKGGAASYKGGADKGVDLTAGAVTIDENLLKIRDGANDLVDGLVQLRDGAEQLNAGLAGKAAPGSKELAAGAGQLDAGSKKLDAGASKLNAGAGKLNAGAGELNDGLKKASAGGPQLLDGVAKLKAGAEKVDAGLVTLRDKVSAGGEGFKSTFAGSVDGAIAQVAAGIAPSVNGALDNLNGLVQASAATDEEKATFAGAVAQTKQGLNNGIKGALTGQLAPGLKAGVNGGVDQLVAGVKGGVGDPATAETLRNGMAQIIGGLGELQLKGGELADGLKQLSTGAGKLKAGTGDLKSGTGTLKDGTTQLSDGTGKLSTGAGTLADGLGDAADGSGKLAAGLETAADKAPALPEGAQQLSDQGTSQLVNVGNGTAMDFGLKYALIEAGSARAASVQPYGSPEGATQLTAYKYELAGATGEGSANVERGIAIAVLAAGGLGLAAFRRRGILG